MPRKQFLLHLVQISQIEALLFQLQTREQCARDQRIEPQLSFRIRIFRVKKFCVRVNQLLARVKHRVIVRRRLVFKHIAFDQIQQRVAASNFVRKIGQRGNFGNRVAVFIFARVFQVNSRRVKVHNQRKPQTQFANLDRFCLQVHTVQIFFNHQLFQIENKIRFRRTRVRIAFAIETE